MCLRLCLRLLMYLLPRAAACSLGVTSTVLGVIPLSLPVSSAVIASAALVSATATTLILVLPMSAVASVAAHVTSMMTAMTALVLVLMFPLLLLGRKTPLGRSLGECLALCELCVNKKPLMAMSLLIL